MSFLGIEIKRKAKKVPMTDMGEFLAEIPSGTVISVHRISPSSYQGIKCTGFAGTVIQTMYQDAAQDILDKFGGGVYKVQARVKHKILICEEQLPGNPKIEIEEEPPELDEKSELDRAFEMVQKLTQLTKGKDDEFMDDIKHYALKSFMEEKEGVEQYLPLVTALFNKGQTPQLPAPNTGPAPAPPVNSQNGNGQAATAAVPQIEQIVQELFKYIVVAFNVQGSPEATASSIIAGVPSESLSQILALSNEQISNMILPLLPPDEILARKLVEFSLNILATIRGSLIQTKDQTNASPDLSTKM